MSSSPATFFTRVVCDGIDFFLFLTIPFLSDSLLTMDFLQNGFYADNDLEAHLRKQNILTREA